MFKSVFSKYTSIFIAINFTGFLVLTTVMTYMIDSYSSSVKYDNLNHMANSMAFFLSREYGYKKDNIFDESSDSDLFIDYNDDFKETLDMLSVERDELTIFEINTDGHIRTYGSSESRPSGDFFKTTATDTVIDSDILNKLSSGKGIKEMGTLNGALSEYRVTVGVPIMYEGEFVGAVFASTLDTKADEFAQTMMMTLIMASLCVMLACLLAVYVISVNLTKPLREMSDAAKEFSKGNFDIEIPVRGNDEIAQLAESFNDMSKSLKNLDYMKSSFVSSVSHELRTPMTTIGGFIDSILEGVIPPESERHYLEIISSEIKRLSRLITSLLEISRMESGQKPLNFTTFDICEMARIILISNEQRLESKKLDVSFECDEDNILVSADRDSIHQILFNICDNAIKFSREGGRYEIKIKDIGDKAEISIYNEGEGISEKDLPFIFDRFYKSDKSRGLDKTGVGLGLFIVKSIIKSHGEDIRAESEYGKWCRFVFTLSKVKGNGNK